MLDQSTNKGHVGASVCLDLDPILLTSYVRCMALREILVIPDKRLREVSKPVGAITDEVRALVADMYETMYDAPGIGLAAIQVGVPLRVVTTDCSAREEDAEPLTLINPEILELPGDDMPYE